MIIPHQSLSPEALQGILEEFVTREGTDYVLEEAPLAQKVRQIRQQLDQGKIVIVYNPDDGSCNLLPSQDTTDRISD